MPFKNTLNPLKPAVDYIDMSPWTSQVILDSSNASPLFSINPFSPMTWIYAKELSGR